MFLLGLLAVGIGWIAASLQVYLRDTIQMLTVIMTLWFWMTPIFIGEENVPENLRFLVRYNPLAGIVRAYRDRLLSYKIPAFEELALLTVAAVGIFVLGGLFFRHLKRGFADVL
jgi:ABC-type polysaccharide/polyol phosphate export permease